MSNRTKIERRLPCELTQEEMADRGKQLGTATRDQEVLETEKKEAMDHFKHKLGGVQADISDLSKQLRSGIEERKVECTYKWHHPTKNKKTLFRDDTGEEVETKDMDLLDQETWKNENAELNLKDKQSSDTDKEKQ